MNYSSYLTIAELNILFTYTNIHVRHTCLTHKINAHLINEVVITVKLSRFFVYDQGLIKI